MDRKLQVGVKCFIKNTEGKYLLLQRATPYLSHDTDFKWDIPGGRINAGEPYLQGLRREIKEETDMDLKNIEKLLAVQDILRNPELHVVRLVFIVATTGEPKIDPKEHRDLGWFTWEEMRSMNVDHFLVPMLKGQPTDDWTTRLDEWDVTI